MGEEVGDGVGLPTGLRRRRLRWLWRRRSWSESQGRWETGGRGRGFARDGEGLGKIRGVEEGWDEGGRIRGFGVARGVAAGGIGSKAEIGLGLEKG